MNDKVMKMIQFDKCITLGTVNNIMKNFDLSNIFYSCVAYDNL